MGTAENEFWGFLDQIFQNIIFQSTTDDEAEEVNGKHDTIEKSIKDDTQEIKEDAEQSDERQSLAESLMDAEDQIDESKVEATHELGELVWARVGSAPYWPSIICHDPTDNKFTQVKIHKRSGSGLIRSFHVQFFGRVQRAWVHQGPRYGFK